MARQIEGTIKHWRGEFGFVLGDDRADHFHRSKCKPRKRTRIKRAVNATRRVDKNLVNSPPMRAPFSAADRSLRK
jgi:hypothetical protein